MARVSEAELERLKKEVSVQRLVEASGVLLKASGKDWVGRCLFHEDDTASLVVTPQKNLWHCFGCGAAGGPVDWVIKTRGVSFRHAVEVLKEGLPLLAADDSGVIAPLKLVKQGTVPLLAPVVGGEVDDAAALEQVVDYYHATLKTSLEALAYLRSRGFEGESASQAIETFKLGFANRTLGLRLPDKNRKMGTQMRGRLEKLGVYRESGHEHLNGSLVIPLFDEQGQVVNLYGRKVTANLRAGTPDHLYLPGPRRGVFNRQALKPGVCEEIIVCEALIDALTFWCAGFRNVTSAYGIEGITEELIEAIAASNAKRVLIAFDRDEAGERGAAKLAEKVLTLGIEARRIVFPKGMDANEYACRVRPASKSLGLLIRKAEWLGKGAALQRKEAMPEVVAICDLKPEVPSLPSLAAQAVHGGEESAAKKKSAPTEQKTSIEEALPAAAQPPMAAEPVPAEVSEREIVLSFGEGSLVRRWRVRGLPKNLAVGALKVNLMVSTVEGRFHVDTLDLYAARARAVFVVQAAGELGQSEGVLKTDLGRVLLKLEALQDEAISQAMAPVAAPAMSERARDEALALLKSPQLLQRIVADFEACGVVGENTNKLVGYLAAVSRLLDRPLAVVIQSSSAAGKSSLMDAVLAFVPEEARTKYSAMTGQSLFYMGQTSLKNRILAIAEEEGASRASYAMKLLQSEGELTIASTGSDPKTGNLITQEYKVEGPTMLMMTTTAIDLDEELLNRCLVLTVDEDREQTRRIHVLQREKRTLAGLTKREAKNSIQATHQNAQRLLRALPVVNPYADGLTFLDDRTRTRRDHEKYLTLIDTLALLHQHQRSIKTAMVNTAEGAKPIEYIEASLEDVEEANAIAHEVLGTSLDELPPHTRGLLKGLHRLVAEQIKVQGVVRSEVRFTRAQVRAHMGLSDTQCRQHLERLVGLEYVLVHRGQRGQSYAYELLHDGPLEEGGAHLAGLIDVAKLRSTTASSRGVLEGFAGSTRPESGPDAGGERMASNLANLGPVRLADELDKKAAKNPFEALENMPVVAYTQALAKSGVIPSLAAIAS
jgi:DNA primase